ncbi:MAG: dicarboxylate/amino acid:cation symporter [Rhodospirillaceae bacterium]
MNLGTKAVIGLAAGLAAGAAIAGAAQPTLLAIGSAVEIVGTIWINAILMTILPLIVAKLVVSIAGHDDARALGRSGWRAGLLFIGLLTATAAATAAIMPAVFAQLRIDPAASETLRRAASAAAGAPARPTAAQWVTSLVPTNAIRAAADGAIVPLIVFTVAFAFGASRIRRELRDPLVVVFRAVDASITVLLHWIVGLAPLGVFALGLGLAMRIGVGIVGALAFYIVVSSAALLAFTALLYAVVWIGAGVSPRDFARAAAPAQVVAFGTHSSMASFPAMLEAAEARLGLSQTATGFVLPLALAVFKYSGPIWFIVVTFFVGRLYGIAIEPAGAVTIVVAAVATSFAVGAVPSGAALVVAPVLVAAGLPVEAMGLLLAVDPIPNGFRTVANVTGMLAVSVLVDGRTQKAGAGGAAACREA